MMLLLAVAQLVGLAVLGVAMWRFFRDLRQLIRAIEAALARLAGDAL